MAFQQRYHCRRSIPTWGDIHAGIGPGKRASHDKPRDFKLTPTENMRISTNGSKNGALTGNTLCAHVISNLHPQIFVVALSPSIKYIEVAHDSPADLFALHIPGNPVCPTAVWRGLFGSALSDGWPSRFRLHLFGSPLCCLESWAGLPWV
jgi:hypothetical protein